jgi:hypothetical protein
MNTISDVKTYHGKIIYMEERITTDNVYIISQYLQDIGYNLNCCGGGSGSSEYTVYELEVNKFYLSLPYETRDHDGDLDIFGSGDIPVKTVGDLISLIDKHLGIMVEVKLKSADSLSMTECQGKFIGKQVYSTSEGVSPLFGMSARDIGANTLIATFRSYK